MNKVLVTCFSASGTTKEVASKLSSISNSDFYEIKPKVPYSKDDLNWMNKQSRSSLEMKDKNSRPKLLDKDLDITNYDTIFIGFPIWWYVAPTIINTFLEAYDFSNKTIILFATSGGSGFGKAVASLKDSVSSSTKIIEGKVFKSNVTNDQLKQFIQNYVD